MQIKVRRVLAVMMVSLVIVHVSAKCEVPCLEKTSGMDFISEENWAHVLQFGQAPQYTYSNAPSVPEEAASSDHLLNKARVNLHPAVKGVTSKSDRNEDNH